MDLGEWLDGLGLAEYAPAFEAHEVRVEDLPDLTADDLREIGLPVGPRRRVLVAAASLGGAGREPVAADPDVIAPTAPTVPSPPTSAELRRMSVMFCDLVGSTSMSTRLEVEALRDVMGTYQDLVRSVVEDHGGHVAKYLGDGLLASFGWPEAAEDQTVRAVRAALDIVRRVDELDVPGAQLASRVGIATGEVVVGDLSGERDAIVGRTANLAARLEGVADPGRVVVDETTAGLTSHEFELDGPVPTELKGFDVPIRTFTVHGPREVSSRFDALRVGARLSTFVGREAELALLQRAWARAASGEGSVIMLGGEAGIGKSRLVHELVESIDLDARHVWRLQCSPAHTASVLHPVLRRIEHAAELRHGADVPEQLIRLRRFLADWPGDPEESTSLVAGYLGLAVPDGRPLDPAQRRAGMLALLLGRVDDVVATSPLLIVFEDLHWSDPTTLELARRLARRIADRPVLLIATHRPEFEVRELGTDRLTALSLDRLPASDVEVLVRRLIDGAADDVVRRVIERTDGNPLYVEELASLAIGDSGAAGHVPASLSASLVAQIDRLGPAKRTAQIASVMGREFPLALLAELLGTDGPEDALEPLLDAGLVLPAGASEDDAMFKHALVRDAAYETLLRSERRSIHERIADLLESPTCAVGAEPELIAQHLAAAEQWTRASEQWLEAGRRASSGGAAAEARSHLLAALELVRRREPSEDRDRAELSVLLELAPVTMAVGGYGAREVEEHYRRAGELADVVGDANERFIATWGAYYVTELQARWLESEANVDALLEMDTSQLRPDLPIQIHHAAATWAGATGHPRMQLEHNARELALYDRELHAAHRFLFGSHDPAVCAHGQSALVHVGLGELDAGIEYARRGLVLARELEHPSTTALASWFEAWTYVEAGWHDRARDAIAATISYSEAHAVGAIRKSVEILHLATLEDRDAAYRQFAARLDPIVARNQSGFLVPQFAALGAEAAIDVGEVEHAFRLVRFAEDVARRTGELHGFGAILFQRGRAHEAAGGARDLDDAVATYRAAVDFCTEREMHWNRIESATALGRLLADRGDTVDAMTVVSDALAALPADLAEPRVVAARRLLAAI